LTLCDTAFNRFPTYSIEFCRHNLRHTSATNKHQLTNDFYTTGKVLDIYHPAVHPQLKQTKKEESGKKPQQIGKKKAAIWNGKRHKPLPFHATRYNCLRNAITLSPMLEN
jgi:hypothetical protein